MTWCIFTIQVLLGALTGLLIAFAIGAAFLAVFYTQVNDLYGKAEELWEGIFNLVAVLLITPMSLAILRAGNSKRKWKRKLENAFSHQNIQPNHRRDEEGEATVVNANHSDDSASASSSSARQAAEEEAGTKTTRTEKLNPLEAVDVVPSMSGDQRRKRGGLRGLFSKPSGAVNDLKLRMNRGTLALFTIPLITTLREGLEGVVFIGGVSLGLPATSIPLPAIVGLAVGVRGQGQCQPTAQVQRCQPLAAQQATLALPRRLETSRHALDHLAIEDEDLEAPQRSGDRIG